jgi:serine protease Do
VRGADPFVAAFRKLRPSVVLFTMRAPSTDPKKKGKFDDAYGSGTIVASGPRGSEILTAAHVVADARNLRATVGERRSFPARVVVQDAGKDLALVTIPAPNLPAAALGDSANLDPGAAIGIAGFPIPDAFADEGLGVATSVFAGRISSLRKDTLELDLPVVPGESGGPVFDAQSGEVIGVAESRFDDERAIGFAIPAQVAKAFIARAEPRRTARR